MQRLINAIRLLYLGLLFATPLLFTSATSELFEVPKMFLVYSLTVLITALHLTLHFTCRTPLTRHSPYNFALFLFLITQAAATVLSFDLHTSIYGYPSRLHGGFLSTFCYFLLFTILPVYLDSAFIRRLINASLASSYLVSIYAVAQHFGIDRHVWVQDVQARVFSTFGQPNWLAAYLCILLPLSLDQMLQSISRQARLASFQYSLGTFVIFTALLYTKSKSGLIAAVVSLGCYFLIYGLNSYNNRRLIPLRVKAALTILPVIFALLLVTISNPIKDWIIPRSSAPAVSSPESPPVNITASEDIRKIVWQGALSLWRKYPILGTGTETFAYSYYWVRPAAHNLTSEWDFLYNKAHNEYLNFLATTGSVGLIAYLFLIAVSLFLMVRALRTASWSQPLALVAAYLSILVTNLAGFSVVVTALFFFVLPLLTFDPQPTSPSPQPKKNWLAVILIGFVALRALSRVLGFITADLAFNQSQKLQPISLTQAYDNIRLSVSTFPTEPVYQIQLAKVTRDLALANKQDQSLSQKYLTESVAASRRAFEISPVNVNLLKEQAYTFYLLSALDPAYFQESVNFLLKIISLAPTDAKAYYTLGQYLETINKKEDAAALYQQAISLKPNYDHAHFALAQIQFQQQQYSQAKTNLQQTLQYAPANTDAQKLLDEISSKSTQPNP